MESARLPGDRIDLARPRWDQNTYWGRAKHFFTVTDPRNILASAKDLEEARKLIHSYRKGEEPNGTTDGQVWRAKKLYESAFHPDTGEKMFLIGRMSAQVPCNMTIVGCMMTFYKTAPAVLFWQWANQTFNAIVNYTNRSGDSQSTTKELLAAYAAATTGAITVAMGLNSLAKKAPPLIGRFVPFAAVAAANGVNIPMMRQRELRSGIPVTDEDGNRLGTSKNLAGKGLNCYKDVHFSLPQHSEAAARKAIASVMVSRVVMSAPGMSAKKAVATVLLSRITMATYMFFPPFVMEYLDKKAFMKRMPALASPIQVCLVGFLLVFATPLCCAIFPQRSSIAVTHLEPELQEAIRKKDPSMKYVYFNKGL